MSLIISLGIDPGLRSTGISAIARHPDGSYQSLGARVSRTEPTKEKAFSRMRSSADDQRRIREHWTQIKNAIDTIKPQVIGIENYLVFEPGDVTKMRESAQALCAFLPNVATLGPDQLRVALQDSTNIHRLLELISTLQGAVSKSTHDAIGLGQAAKTIAVYGAALSCAYSAGVPVFVFQPSDLKQRFGQRRGASKEEVGDGLEALVVDLKAKMDLTVPQKTMKEHAWDATGHAILAADELALYMRDQSSAAVAR